MPDYRFDHVHLMSADPVKMAEFYEKMFAARRVGIEPTADGRVRVNLDLKGTTILISALADSKSPSGLDHFGIKTDKIGKAVAELKASGVKFTREIKEVRPGFKIAFFIAPENVPIELMEGN